LPSWNDLGPAFQTLRELDVSAIREEAERSLMIACVGEVALRTHAARLLRTSTSLRYGPDGFDPLLQLPLQTAPDDLRAADLVLVVLDGRRALPAADTQALERIAQLGVPMVVLIAHAALPAEAQAVRPAFAHARFVVLPDLLADDAAERLAEAVLDRLPSDRQIAAARRLPGLRSLVARELITTTSFSNATYALASALPEQIPILSVPFAVADILVLTKNQALLVYKLALAHGAPPEFQERIREVLPVIGGAYMWRQLARTLVGLVPVWGVVPKVAIAYAGTYATGIAAARWFADSEIVSPARLKAITQEALEIGRIRAQALVDSAKPKSIADAQPNWFQRNVEQVRQRLPRRKSPPKAPEDRNPPPK
jgi:uncharacterized protein (DUF697 family)